MVLLVLPFPYKHCISIQFYENLEISGCASSKKSYKERNITESLNFVVISFFLPLSKHFRSMQSSNRFPLKYYISNRNFAKPQIFRSMHHQKYHTRKETHLKATISLSCSISLKAYKESRISCSCRGCGPASLQATQAWATADRFFRLFLLHDLFECCMWGLGCCSSAQGYHRAEPH